MRPLDGALRLADSSRSVPATCNADHLQFMKILDTVRRGLLAFWGLCPTFTALVTSIEASACHSDAAASGKAIRLHEQLLRRENLPGAAELVDGAAAHHEVDAFQPRHVLQRVSGDRDDVRVLAGLDRADAR